MAHKIPPHGNVLPLGTDEKVGYGKIKEMNKRLKKLLKLRQEFATYGNVSGVQWVNQEIAKIARKMKVNYYSL